MAQAFLLAALLLAPVLPAAEEHFDACDVTATRAVCAWTLASGAEAPALGSSAEFSIPVFPTTLATFRIAYRAVAGAPDYGANGWNAEVVDRDAPADAPPIASFSHDGGSASQPSLLRDRTYYAVFPATPGGDHALRFTGRDAGDYTVEYEAVLPPAGAAPERPAASLEKPHLMGAPSGLQPAGLDIVAAWMTDDRMGDGIFEARIAVVDLADLDAGAEGGMRGEILWIYDFTIAERGYRTWIETDQAADGITLCELFAVEDEEFGSFLEIASIWCELDLERSIVVAHIPEAALGSPAAGAPFTGMVARTVARETAVGGFVAFATGANDPQKVDRVDSQRFGFALGGPVVWDELNGCAFCVAAPGWAEAPFADEHVGNTLQLLAILAAIGAFLFGLVVVRRRRARVKRLFDAVDAVVRAHPADTRAGLLALGALEADFDERYRSGRLHENEYQLASQRIATAATRLSLRRDLGLDDGTPGDEPHLRGVRR